MADCRRARSDVLDVGRLQAIGRVGEEAALKALTARGYRVVARNMRLRAGELDLVCLDRGAFVFCEVKARRPSAFGTAREALTWRKRARLVCLAQAYLARIGRRDAAWRLELIAIELDEHGLIHAVEVVPVD